MSDEINLNQLIEKDRQERLNNCLRDIEEIMKKYNCELVASPIIKPNGTISANVLVNVK